MQEVFGTRLQLDSAIETNAANSGLQMVDKQGDPRLRHEGARMPTNDEVLFLARTAFRDPLILNEKRSIKVIQAFESVAATDEPYDKYLTPEIALACLQAIERSRLPAMSLVPGAMPVQQQLETMPRAV